jgi:hypothetical protein
MTRREKLLVEVGQCLARAEGLLGRVCMGGEGEPPRLDGELISIMGDISRLRGLVRRERERRGS